MRGEHGPRVPKAPKSPKAAIAQILKGQLLTEALADSLNPDVFFPHVAQAASAAGYPFDSSN
jgi:hypothetical protein